MFNSLKIMTDLTAAAIVGNTRHCVGNTRHSKLHAVIFISQALTL